MAGDTFMWVKNSSDTVLKGDSTDSECLDWIELMGVSFSAAQATIDYAGGSTRTAGKASHSDLSVSKLSDASSGELYGHCIKGDILKKVVVRCFRPIGGGTTDNPSGKFCFQTITMTDVIISSYSQSGGGGIPSESITLNPGTFTMRYVPYDVEDRKEETASVHSYDIIKGEVDVSTDTADADTGEGVLT
jgi:type VI secretion system secreted protein Hcp